MKIINKNLLTRPSGVEESLWGGKAAIHLEAMAGGMTRLTALTCHGDRAFQPVNLHTSDLLAIRKQLVKFLAQPTKTREATISVIYDGEPRQMKFAFSENHSYPMFALYLTQASNAPRNTTRMIFNHTRQSIQWLCNMLVAIDAYYKQVLGVDL